MILAIDATLPVPVSEQIRAQIARMVVSGTLSAGIQVPTIRQLASDLGIAKGTIQRAYDLLESDAMLESRGRHGTFVSETNRPMALDREALTSAAEVFVMVAMQLGAERETTLRTVTDVWNRNIE
jgi:GntR family transcriptional regulator